MSPQDSNRRISPGLVLWLACISAALVVLITLQVARFFPTRAGKEAPTAMQPSVVVKSLPVAEPIAVSAPAMQAAVDVSPDTTDQSMTMEGQWGIKISDVLLAHEDAVVQMCYTIIAPNKAALLADGQTTAYIMDQVSGAKIPIRSVPAGGSFSAHSTARSAALMKLSAGLFPPAPNHMIAGRAYFIMLPNQAEAIKRGSLVSVVVGNVRTDNIVVK